MSTFLESGDSRRTSDELLEVIYNLADGDERRAVQIWEAPSRLQVRQIARLLRRRGINPRSTYWGAANNCWMD